MNRRVTTLARILAVAGLLGVAIAVGGAVLTGAMPRQFVVVGPAAGTVSPSPSTPAAAAGSSPTAAPGLGTVHVVAIGDSVTAGTNCDCTPFPQLYAQDLANTYRVKAYVRNDGVAGETSADVLDDLKSDGGERHDIADGDIVVVTIGANDFGGQYDQVANGDCGGASGLACARSGLAKLPDNLTAIVQQIRRLRHGAPTAILLTGYWNVFEDGDVAKQSMSARGRAESDALSVATNQVVERVAQDQQATYVDLYSPFKGHDGSDDPTDLLADDGDHPNAAGHRVIAKALVRAGTAPLTLG